MNPIIYQSQAIFLIFAVEESTQPTKYANKILVSICLTMKATILDTQGISFMSNHF